MMQDLAMAMEARCYRGGEGRTRLHTMKLQSRDAAAAAVLLLFAAAIAAETYLFGIFLSGL